MADPTHNPVSNPAFVTPLTGLLRAKGIRGKALVTATADGLSITGEKGGNLRVLYTQVERIRSGWHDTKSGRIHETHVWLSGEEKPMSLIWQGRRWENYAAVIRGFARQVASRGQEKVWRGTSKVSALLMLVLAAPLFLAAAGVGIFVLDNDEWWQRILPSLPAAVLIWAGCLVAKQSWPRPVKDLEEFDASVAKDGPAWGWKKQ